MRPFSHLNVREKRNFKTHLVITRPFVNVKARISTHNQKTEYVAYIIRIYDIIRIYIPEKTVKYAIVCAIRRW